MPPLRAIDEFTAGAADWPDELSRRKFIKLMGASIALAGTSCTRQPPEKIVPYVRQPEEVVPGKPLYYATALTLGGYARGVLVETHEGRPTKIEGNPEHPASLGTSDAFIQAELLTLYDPERSQAVIREGQVSTWDLLLGDLTSAASTWKANGGAGLRLLTRHETSPTFLDQIAGLLAKYPSAKWHEYEPLAANAPHACYHCDKAEVILSLGGDFLASGPWSLRHAREFAAARRPNETMNRLYVAESTPTLTGAIADHRIVLRPDEVEQFARDLQSGSGSEIVRAISADLRAHAGRSLVIGGEFESAAIQDAARQLNETLGNIGVTVDYVPRASSAARDLSELVRDVDSGVVGTSLILGATPAADAPADFEFAKLLSKVSRTIHLGLYRDETAELCRWHAAEAHGLENWSDARALDGTVTIVQPMIEPLFAGRSRHELLAALLDEPPRSSYEIVHAFWQTQHASADFEVFWRKSLHDGVVVNAPAPPSNSSLRIPPA